MPAIRAAAARGTPVHVLLNNNRGNYAVVNAFDFAALLDLGPTRPPPPVLERMVERDGYVPQWVERAAPPPRPAPGPELPGQAVLDLPG